jgi:hypothetical protein
MSREVKRVAIDFKWPLEKVWAGFVNPHNSETCAECAGTGYAAEARKISDLWRGRAPFRPEDNGSVPFSPYDPDIRAIIEPKCRREPNYYGTSEADITREANRMLGFWNARLQHHLNDKDIAILVAAGELKDFTHDWVRGQGWVPKENPVIPTAREVNLRSLHPLASSGASAIIAARVKEKGLPYECTPCGGAGSVFASPEIEKKHDEWQEIDPPEGEGYQVWETVSEGSPISPVFANPGKLAEWMAKSSRSDGMDADAWYKFITEDGWAPSFVGTSDGRVVSGVEAVTSGMLGP